VHMFDIMLIREFGVEEINAQNVAKSFVEGARMAGIIDERNVIADIDQLVAQQGPRRELAAGEMPLNLFKGSDPGALSNTAAASPNSLAQASPPVLDQLPKATSSGISRNQDFVPQRPSQPDADHEDSDSDPVSALFGLNTSTTFTPPQSQPMAGPAEVFRGRDHSAPESSSPPQPAPPARPTGPEPAPSLLEAASPSYLVRISGPGVDTQLQIQDTDDLEIVRILLEKIRKQLNS